MILAAATFLDEYDLTPFDPLHAGPATTGDERVLLTELDYDTVGFDRNRWNLNPSRACRAIRIWSLRLCSIR
jgi:hypothetical protein